MARGVEGSGDVRRVVGAAPPAVCIGEQLPDDDGLLLGELCPVEQAGSGPLRADGL